MVVPVQVTSRLSEPAADTRGVWRLRSGAAGVTHVVRGRQDVAISMVSSPGRWHAHRLRGQRGVGDGSDGPPYRGRRVGTRFRAPEINSEILIDSRRNHWFRLYLSRQILVRLQIMEEGLIISRRPTFVPGAALRGQLFCCSRAHGPGSRRSWVQTDTGRCPLPARTPCGPSRPLLTSRWGRRQQRLVTKRPPSHPPRA